MSRPVKLQWHNTDAELIDLHTDTVIFDLMKSVHEDLNKPSELIFHHVFLSEEMGGPHVFVWGKDGSDAYQCEYVTHTVWGVSADESE